jgi:hypothetical protein
MAEVTVVDLAFRLHLFVSLWFQMKERLNSRQFGSYQLDSETRVKPDTNHESFSEIDTVILKPQKRGCFGELPLPFIGEKLALPWGRLQ